MVEFHRAGDELIPRNEKLHFESSDTELRAEFKLSPEFVIVFQAMIVSVAL